MVQRLLLRQIDAAGLPGRCTNARRSYRTRHADHAIQRRHVELLWKLRPIPTIDGHDPSRWYPSDRRRCYAYRWLRYPMVAHACHLLPTCNAVRSQLRNNGHLVATLHVLPIPSSTRSVDGTCSYKPKHLCSQSLPSDQCARLLSNWVVRQCPCNCVVPSGSTTPRWWRPRWREYRRTRECGLCRQHRIKLRPRIDVASPHYELWELWGKLRILTGSRDSRQQLPRACIWHCQPDCR